VTIAFGAIANRLYVLQHRVCFFDDFLKPLLLSASTFHQPHIISLGQVAIAAAGRFLEQQFEELSLGESEQERRGQSEQQYRFSSSEYGASPLQHQNQ